MYGLVFNKNTFCRVDNVVKQTFPEDVPVASLSLRLDEDEETPASESLFDIGQKNFETVWREGATKIYPCAYGVQAGGGNDSVRLEVSLAQRISSVVEGMKWNTCRM